jgi:YVTN family beta-propeller protein
MRKVISLSLLVAAAAFAAFAASTGYHVLKEIKIGGDGGWDYLEIDATARRLYVSHGNHVVVVDPDAGKVVGDIPDTPGVHGVQIVQSLNRGFISNGRGNNVTIFDLKTLKTISQPATGQNPDDIRYEPKTGRVFTFNGRSNDATVIDAKTGMVVATIPVGGKPEFAVADDKGHVYANVEDTNEVIEIDAAKPAITKRYSIKPCDGPSGMAIDTAKRRLFSVCGNRMMAISEPDSGKVIATPAIGPGPDGVVFDASNGYAMSSNGGDGTLTIVKENAGKWEVQENIATQRGARTIALDPKTHNIYLPTAEQGPPPPAGQRGRGAFLPDSFKIVVVGK